MLGVHCAPTPAGCPAHSSHSSTQCDTAVRSSRRLGLAAPSCLTMLGVHCPPPAGCAGALQGGRGAKQVAHARSATQELRYNSPLLSNPSAAATPGPDQHSPAARPSQLSCTLPGFALPSSTGKHPRARQHRSHSPCRSVPIRASGRLCSWPRSPGSSRQCAARGDDVGKWRGVCTSCCCSSEARQ